MKFIPVGVLVSFIVTILVTLSCSFILWDIKIFNLVFEPSNIFGSTIKLIFLLLCVWFQKDWINWLNKKENKK